MEVLFWRDYFNLLGQAITRLGEAVYYRDSAMQDFIQDATIEKVDSTTPRDVISKAFQFKLIDDETIWLNILDDRNITSHVYRQEDAQRVFAHLQKYLPVFENSYKQLKEKYNV